MSLAMQATSPTEKLYGRFGKSSRGAGTKGDGGGWSLEQHDRHTSNSTPSEKTVLDGHLFIANNQSDKIFTQSVRCVESDTKGTEINSKSAGLKSKKLLINSRKNSRSRMTRRSSPAKLAQGCYHKPYTFEDLDQINSNRRDHAQGLKAGGDFRTKASRLFSQLSSSVFVDVLCDFQFWIVQAAFWIVRYLGGGDEYSVLRVLPSMGSTAFSICSSLLIFSLVFYVTQCYSRFWAQYECAMACEGRIFDSILMAKSSMTREAAWRLYRHINAAHVLAYVGLGQVYNEHNLFYPFNEKRHLLTVSELSRLQTLGFSGGSVYREVLSWAVEGIARELKAERMGEFEWSIIMGNILGLRSKLGTIYDYVDQPIPFSYVTLMSSTIFVFLLIFSVSVAYSYDPSGPSISVAADSIVEYIYVLFFSVLLLGLRWLAYRLQDPFGNYDEDLSILHYVRFTVSASCRLLAEKKIRLTSAKQERELCYMRGVQYGDEEEEEEEEDDEEEEEEEEGEEGEEEEEREEGKYEHKSDGDDNDDDVDVGHEVVVGNEVSSSQSTESAHATQ